MRILKKMVRIYVHDLSAAIDYYQKLTGEPLNRRFAMPEVGLELASIGDILLISGKEEDLAPFRQTSTTFLVDSLDEFKTFLENSGAVILKEPAQVPTGRNMTVQHPDGTIVEYVEHS
ncbi:VOC family protein [Aeribacillus sp. FSL K6-8210]|jgi:predicted enzyme related to lactoylglutathione lyase|uniref:VOC family protein n=1 Tax=unclassified Aeribacillus TaxID=2640495 RepID=UPI0030CB11F9